MAQSDWKSKITDIFVTLPDFVKSKVFFQTIIFRLLRCRGNPDKVIQRFIRHLKKKAKYVVGCASCHSYYISKNKKGSKKAPIDSGCYAMTRSLRVSWNTS